MPWLVVLGTGTWGYGRTTYPAGKHQVDDATAEAARSLGSPVVLVTDEEPHIVENRPDGEPLSLKDIRVGVTTHGVRLAEVAIEEVAVHERDPRDEHACPYCSDAKPSAAALVRHIEFHHEVPVD